LDCSKPLPVKAKGIKIKLNHKKSKRQVRLNK